MRSPNARLCSIRNYEVMAELGVRKSCSYSRATGSGLLVLFVVVALACTVSAAEQGDAANDVFERPSAVQSHRSLEEDKSGTGVHDKFALTPRTGLALGLTCVCALLANAAGIGGGPIYLPLLMVVLGFDLTPATALSHTIVATSAIASSIYGLIATSPNSVKRSLIDWDLTIFIPALLVGVSVGVLFNVLFPIWLQTVLLTILLVVVIVKTLGKGVKMWRSEQHDAKLKDRVRAEQDLGPHETDSEEEGILHEEAYHIKPHRITRSLGRAQQQARAAAAEEQGGSQQPLLPPGGQHEAPQEARSIGKAARGCLSRQPVAKILAVILLWALFLVTQQFKSNYDRCSPTYLSIFAGQLVLLTLFTALGVWNLSRQATKDPQHVDPELREVLTQPDSSSSGGKSKPLLQLTLVAAVMAFAGALAGLLGIGARALIFNPFLLALGVHPQVTASTSVLMILFSSSAISISLGFQGYLNASYASIFAPLAFVSSIVGVTVVGKLIKRTGHTSIIVFILTFLITVGCVITAIFGSLRAYHEYKQGAPMGLAPFCEK